MCSPASEKLTFEFEMETEKTPARSRSHVGQLSLHSDFLRFYFCTCTFQYYQLQLKKNPSGMPHALLCKDIKSATTRRGSGVFRVFSFPSWTDASRDSDKTTLLFLQSKVYRKS